jgi:hypothetical protein
MEVDSSIDDRRRDRSDPRTSSGAVSGPPQRRIEKSARMVRQPAPRRIEWVHRASQSSLRPRVALSSRPEPSLPAHAEQQQQRHKMFWTVIALTLSVFAVCFFTGTGGALIYFLPVAAAAAVVVRKMGKPPNTEFGRWRPSSERYRRH